MALSKPADFNGIKIDSAYIKVENVNVSKDSLTANVTWRVSAESAPFKSKSYAVEYDISGKNPLAQAYDRLKMLDEFSGAVDA